MAAKRASEKAKSRRVFGQARKSAKMFRAGLYARVSTNDQQTIPLQIRAMREYAVRRGWTIALHVKEVGSGASQRQLREKLLEAARRRVAGHVGDPARVGDVPKTLGEPTGPAAQQNVLEDGSVFAGQLADLVGRLGVFDGLDLDPQRLARH